MAHNRRMFGGRPGGPGGHGGHGGHLPSPWEGGVVPGQGRPASAGILGAAPQPMNLLSQLSTPEAQLALASNLLTSLLGQQQQQTPPMQQPRGPPGPQPLLSMNASAPGRGFFPRPDGMKHGGPMRQQRNHGSRFPDSYKQARGGDGRPRPHVPLKRGGGAGGQQRGQRKTGGAVSNKSSPTAEKKSTEVTNAEKSSTEESTANEESEVSIKEESREEEEDEEAEGGKKREWKEEKNIKKENVMNVDEEDVQNSEDMQNSEDGQGKVKNKFGSDGKGQGEGKGKPNKDGSKKAGTSDASRYSTIPKELLVCHICNKNMWDGQSFENHLRGKSHQMMMDQTEKSYKVQVKLMRQELKLAEEKREIEMERVQRLGKKVNLKAREYCTMCDLYFFGNIMGHRKNHLHQNLKNFLHPRCTLCCQEFPSRTEWDHHQLTPIHLIKLVESRKNDGKDSSEVAVMVEDKPAAAEGEEGKTGESEASEAAAGETAATEGEGMSEAATPGATPSGGAVAGASGGNAAGAGAPCPPAATPGTKRTRQPVQPYDPKKTYGVHLLKKVLGYTCDVCNRFFFQHKEALAHCQTAPHYKSYVAHLLRSGAAAPPGSPTRKPPAAAAAAPAPVPAPAQGDKAAAEKGEKDKGADDGPEGKRARKDAEGADAKDGVAETKPQPMEQGADSTTESEAKGAGDVPPVAAAAATAAAPALEPATNGTDASDGAADEAEEAAPDEEEDAKSDTDKSANPADDAATDEEAVTPKAEDKKSSPGTNRRGAARGVGRGRGRGHRRR